MREPAIRRMLWAMQRCCLLAALTISALFAANLRTADGTPAARAYARLLRDGFPEPPASVTQAAKRAILAALPSDGEVELSANTRGKLALLDSVLAAYGRTAVTEIRVVRLPYACAALHARVVLIIAEHTLQALSAEELQAVTAHELGHEHFWAEYYKARVSNDTQLMRETELLADAIAIRTLIRLGKDPKTLISAVKRINSYNARLGLQAINTSTHPPINERKLFHKAITELIGR